LGAYFGRGPSNLPCALGSRARGAARPGGGARRHGGRARHRATGRRLKTIPTLPDPRAIERVGGVAVVAHTEQGALTLVDAATLRVRKVLRGFAEPRYAAASPEGRYAYVSDSGTGEIVVVDVVRGRVAGRARVGGPARHLSLSPSGRRLWAALGTRARRLVALDVRDPTRPRVVRRFTPPWLAHDVGFAPWGGRAWVTSGGSRELVIYDLRTGRIARRLPAGAPPQHVTFIGGLAFVTSGDDGTLEARSAADGRLRGTTRVPLGSYNVQEAFGYVVTPSLSLGTLCIADRRGRIVHRVRAARSSHDACFVMSR
jgi:DNA-binding beta-propeller fold protein YncE